MRSKAFVDGLATTARVLLQELPVLREIGDCPDIQEVLDQRVRRACLDILANGARREKLEHVVSMEETAFRVNQDWTVFQDAVVSTDFRV